MNRGDRKMNFDTEFINCVDEIQRVALIVIICVQRTNIVKIAAHTGFL